MSKDSTASESALTDFEPTQLSVNGVKHTVYAASDAPLLYILRNDFKLKGAKFGCGAGECGACTVLLDGDAVRSCDTPLWSVGSRAIVTIEALSSGGAPGVLQQAFIDEQALQCGYCVNGIIMAATALLDRNSRPSESEIKAALARNLCRCGSYNRMIKAIQRAAQELAS